MIRASVALMSFNFFLFFSCDSGINFLPLSKNIKEIAIGYKILCVTDEQGHPNCFSKDPSNAIKVDGKLSLNAIELMHLDTTLVGIDDKGNLHFAGKDAEKLTNLAIGPVDITQSNSIAVNDVSEGLCVLNQQQQLKCAGMNDPEKLLDPNSRRYKFIASSLNTVCAIDMGNIVSCFGEYNDTAKDQITSGLIVKAIPKTQQFSFLTMVSRYPYPVIFGIKTDGRLMSWGSKQDSMHWVNDAENSRDKFKHVVVTNAGLCGIKIDGTVSCFGDKAKIDMPSQSMHFTTIRALGNTFCGVTDKKIYCWGDKNHLPYLMP